MMNDNDDYYYAGGHCDNDEHDDDGGETLVARVSVTVVFKRVPLLAQEIVAARPH